MTDQFKDLDPAERKKLDDGIKKIDEVLAQGRLHPVVRDVLFLLQDEQGWLKDFPLARLQELQSTILATEKATGTKLQLVDAVFDLFKLSSALWDIGPAKHAATVLYALPRTGDDATTSDVWQVPADGSGSPSVLVPSASSPAVVAGPTAP